MRTPLLRTYGQILTDLLALLFIGLAIYHETQKPGLPNQFSGAGQLIINGVALMNGDEIEFAESSHRIGDKVSVAPSAGTPPAVVALTGYYDWPVIVLDAVVALLLFGSGVVVVHLRPADKGARVYHIGSIVTAMALAGSRTIYSLRPDWLGSILTVTFFLAYTVIPVLFAHFTFVFPTIRWKNYRRLVGGLYAVGCAIALWSALMYLQAADARSVDLLRKFFIAAMAQNAFAVIGCLTGIASFVMVYQATTAPADRMKIRWLMYGLVFGPAPFVLLWAFPSALGMSPWIAEWVLKLFLLLVPATFAISIVRYRLLDIDLLINRSLVYSIVVGTGGLIYVLLLLGAANLATSFTHEASIVVATAAAALFALGFNPARRRVQVFVDKKFFRVQYDFRQSLRTITQSVMNCLTANDVAAMIVERLDRLLPMERIGFFTLGQPGNRIRLLSHKGFDLLVAHGTRFDAEHLRSRLDLPVALDDRIEPGILHEGADEEMFHRWGIALIVPILSKQKAILGFLVLGEKKSGLRFTAEDVDLLVAVSAPAGMAIERLALQEQLLVEQAETQRLEELNQLKSYFVSSVSHDLKTPLTSIRMFAELLRTSPSLSSDRSKEYLRIIEGESERLTRLINNVLDFAKIERGIKEYHFVEVELNDLTRRTISALDYQFRMQQFTVTLNIWPGAIVLHADPDALTEAFINILSNAMKYSADVKDIVVSTFVRNERAGISVCDRGIGISREDIDQLFEPFFRAKNGAAHGATGAGLGLSVVKHIVDAHGGTIEVDSRPGAGSTFTLLLPLQPITKNTH